MIVKQRRKERLKVGCRERITRKEKKKTRSLIIVVQVWSVLLALRRRKQGMKREKKKSETDKGPRSEGPQYNHIRLILQSPKNNPNKQIKDQINTSSIPTSKKNQSTRGGGAHGPPLLSRSHLGGPQYREAREPPHYGNRPQDANSDKVRQETWTPKGLFRRLARSKNRQRNQT